MSERNRVTHDLKPYPAYRDSGVPWLGEVPEHWELLRLGALLEERGEVNRDGSIDEVLSVLRNRGVIPYSEKGNIGNKRSEDITRYKIVRPNDIVVNCMNVIIGSVGLSRYTGCLSPVYYVLKARAEEDNPRYLNAYFQTKPFQESLVRIGYGILAHRMRIPMEQLKREPFPRPPATEQAVIVRYLDYMDRRIRRYTRAKQALIKLLEEQKQSIIHEAVTGQVDVRTGQPYPAYKPSGVEWLGEVPEHWNLIPIKRLLSKMDYGTSEATKEDGQVRVLTMGNIQNGEVTDVSYGRLDSVSNELLLEQHDLLFTRTNGNPNLVGKIGIFRGNSFDRVSFASYLVRFRAKEIHNPQWLHMLLSNSLFWKYAQSHALVNLQTNLNPTRYSQFPIPTPSRAEQDLIAEYVNIQTGLLQKSIDNERKQINFLKEYQTRLIADVVTGKLDVRQAAAGLPEEVAEPELLEEVADIDADDAMADDLDEEIEEEAA